MLKPPHLDLYSSKGYSFSIYPRQELALNLKAQSMCHPDLYRSLDNNAWYIESVLEPAGTYIYNQSKNHVKAATLKFI